MRQTKVKAEVKKCTLKVDEKRLNWPIEPWKSSLAIDMKNELEQFMLFIKELLIYSTYNSNVRNRIFPRALLLRRART